MKKCNALLSVTTALLLSCPLSGMHSQESTLLFRTHSKGTTFSTQCAGIGLISTGIALPTLLVNKPKTKKGAVLLYTTSALIVVAGVGLAIKPEALFALFNSDKNSLRK